MRKINSYKNGSNSANVYRNSEWKEYIVKFYRNGYHMGSADYHTDDKKDALDTAQVELQYMAKSKYEKQD